MVTALGTPGMASSSLPSSPVVVGKKYVIVKCGQMAQPWAFLMLCLIYRYAERTNKGEVVVKHGVEDGWGAGCKATVQLPPGMTGHGILESKLHV